MIRKNPDRHLSLSKNVERVASPPSIHDSAAHAKLHCALAGAACRLAKLKADPIVIAASPNRYNDIYWSDWRAVRFASFFAERHDYYGGAREYERELGNGPCRQRFDWAMQQTPPLRFQTVE